MDENSIYDIKDLKEYLLDGVSLEEIASKELSWCVGKWCLITACTLAQEFEPEVFADKECFYGFVLAALGERIQALGGKVTPFKDIELPKAPV